MNMQEKVWVWLKIGWKNKKEYIMGVEMFYEKKAYVTTKR